MINNYICRLKQFFTNCSHSFQELKNLFKRLLANSIIESFFLLTIVLTGSFFMQSITYTISIVLLIIGKNSLLRFIALIFQRSHLPFKDAAVLLIYFFMAANFALIFNGIAATVLHEMAHAFAAYIMYVDPNPLVQVIPFSGGVTTYIADILTPVGIFFGHFAADVIISSAGCFITLLFAFLLLFLANKKHHLSQLSIYLNTCAIYVIAADALYAFSAINNTSSGHDFFTLWEAGIHPLLSAFFLLAAPLVFSFFCLKIKKSKHVSLVRH